MEEYFYHNERLGIDIPTINEWDDLSVKTQQSILLHWENIRGMIPDQIIELEQHINDKQAQLDNESDFETSCQLNTEIAELASIINDLWLWFRTHQDITKKIHF